MKDEHCGFFVTYAARGCPIYSKALNAWWVDKCVVDVRSLPAFSKMYVAQGGVHRRCYQTVKFFQLSDVIFHEATLRCPVIPVGDDSVSSVTRWDMQHLLIQ